LPKNYKGFLVLPSELKIKNNTFYLFLIIKAGVTPVHAVSIVWYRRTETVLMMPNIMYEYNIYRKSGYNMYRGWTQTAYQNKHYNINQKDKGT